MAWQENVEDGGWLAGMIDEKQLLSEIKGVIDRWETLTDTFLEIEPDDSIAFKFLDGTARQAFVIIKKKMSVFSLS